MHLSIYMNGLHDYFSCNYCVRTMLVASYKSSYNDAFYIYRTQNVEEVHKIVILSC